MATVEREHQPGDLLEIRGLDLVVERLACEHGLGRRVAPVAGEQRAPDPHQRILLGVGAVGPTGQERPRQLDVRELRPAPEPEQTLLAVERDDLACVAAGLVERLLADLELVLLSGIASVSSEPTAYSVRTPSSPRPTAGRRSRFASSSSPRKRPTSRRRSGLSSGRSIADSA
jgi:hypothetical protein